MLCNLICNVPASGGRRALPIAILEVDLYRSIVLDTFVTTACLPHYVPNDNSTARSSNVVDISDGGYKINVAAGWGSIDSRCTPHNGEELNHKNGGSMIQDS